MAKTTKFHSYSSEPNREHEKADVEDLTFEHVSQWLSEHGEPTANQLYDLASTKTSQSMETLRELADQYNVSYDKATTLLQLADRIIIAMEKS